ncbi:Uu.00g012890.m01.CDS01 [Anthostomella pinea]|uniref:Uu.00g012890.m01.CDS01 n=1 Tax=Anthostomella pinea TaxID=933095 RepID=A0AAI8VYY3_9PEZI|nr:Uu.00g012890.m01.CDS01 [Anthostomella pinea]
MCDATICFLFQPLMRRALRLTQDLTESSPTTNASEAGVLVPSPRRLREEGKEDCEEGTWVDGNGCRRESESTTPPVAADSFWLTCNPIRTCERVIRAPEGSVLGAYPMTFMPAHYIWIASNTLLAHALLAVDGRTRLMPRFSDGGTPGDGGGEEDAGRRSGSQWDVRGEAIDYGVFVDISGSCLILMLVC